MDILCLWQDAKKGGVLEFKVRILARQMSCVCVLDTMCRTEGHSPRSILCGSSKSGDGYLWFGCELRPLDLQYALRVVLRERNHPSTQPSDTWALAVYQRARCGVGSLQRSEQPKWWIYEENTGQEILKVGAFPEMWDLSGSGDRAGHIWGGRRGGLTSRRPCEVEAR